MSNDLTKFVFEGHQIRVVMQNGEPEWIAKDVCEGLDIKNPSDALSSLDEDEKGIANADTLGGQQPMLTVKEPGLYRLATRSRTQKGKRFQRWLFHEVIPSIRKNGVYVTDALLDNPEHLLQVTERLVAERRARIAERQARLAAESKVAELAPKGDFYDAVVASANSVEIRKFAKAIDAGPNKFLNWLRDGGFLLPDRLPKQRYIEEGYFEVELRTYERKGKTHTYLMTMITGKGKPYFYRKWKEATEVKHPVQATFGNMGEGMPDASSPLA